MKSKIMLVGAIVAISLCLFACTPAQSELSISVDAFYTGEQCELAVQDSYMTVTLLSNPSTGFEWELTEITNETVIELADYQFISPEGAEDGEPLVGAPGKEMWTFKAVCEGESNVSLEYSRPWENGTKAAETLTLVVNASTFPSQEIQSHEILSVAALLGNPVYDTGVRVFGKVGSLGELDCTCFELNYAGETVKVWYDSMVEDDGTIRPPVSIKGIENGDYVIVTGELKTEGKHTSLNDFWASNIEKLG